MRTLLANVLAGFLVAGALHPVSAQTQIRWLQDLPQAQQIARQEGRLLLIHFYSDSCPRCRRLEQIVFPYGEVCRAMAANYVPVIVNGDRDRATAGQFQVDAWPTDVIADAQGRIIYKTVSPQDPARYAQLLNAVAADFRATMAPVAAANQSPPPGPAAAYAFAGYNSRADGRASDAAPGMGNPAALAGTGDPYRPQGESPAYAPAPAPQEQANPYVTGYRPEATNQVSPQPSVYDARNSWAPPAAAGTVAPDDTVRQAMARPADSLGPSGPQWQENRFAAGPNAPGPSFASAPADPVAANPPPAGTQYALDGFCPVTLLEQESWVKGDPRWGVLHRGSVYLFLSEQHMQRFQADPDRYAPVLSGFDPARYIDRGELVPGKRAHGNWFRGKTYLFADKASQERFEQMPEYYAQRAHEIMMATGR